MRPIRRRWKRCRASERAIDPAHAAQATWLKVARRLIADTKDVGEHFRGDGAPDALRVRQGTRYPGRGARPRKPKALLDKGIPVLPLLLPRSLEEPLQ